MPFQNTSYDHLTIEFTKHVPSRLLRSQLKRYGQPELKNFVRSFVNSDHSCFLTYLYDSCLSLKTEKTLLGAQSYKKCLACNVVHVCAWIALYILIPESKAILGLSASQLEGPEPNCNNALANFFQNS